MVGLQVLKNVVSERARGARAVWLLEYALDHIVLNEDGVTLGAHTLSQRRYLLLHVDGLGEGGQRIGENSNFTVGLEFLAPGFGHKRIIYGHAGQNAITLGSDLLNVLDETRQMRLKIVQNQN